MTDYFSDREQGNNANRAIEFISQGMWDGIRSLIQRYIGNNGLSKDFSAFCPDGNVTCGCESTKLDKAIHAIIPRMESIDSYENIKRDELLSSLDGIPITDEQRTYDVLDLIEFVYKHLNDCKKLDYHEYYKHYHIEFIKGSLMKDTFRDEINDIFRRNLLAYELCDDGKIRRLISIALAELFKVKHNTTDKQLNDILDLAINRFLSPKIEDRRIGLEKLWDAFERLKTIECVTGKQKEKSVSADKVLTQMGNGSQEFTDLLYTEAKALRGIGNGFQIRHFETNKTNIKDSGHIDYLFYRMYAFVYLFLNKYNCE